ncbi:MAG: lipocalin-like domain-containing protein [Bryobacteraceae bacterium]
MRIDALAALFFVGFTLSAQQWQPALPGYQYQFPRDHFDHPDYQTEWWYYTGNLRAPDGHRFGFELTFFRQASKVDSASAISPVWGTGQIYLAHLALSDIDGHEFYHTRRLNRAGPGLAGGSLHDSRYWNGNWQVRWLDVESGHQALEAVCDRFRLQLDLTPEKAPVIHGREGVSRKGPLPGEASHYLSFTRLRAKGDLQWKNTTYSLTGLAWMDHEFFTEPADDALLGWDWFAIQLNNRQELMLYRIRRNSGEKDHFSSGTFVDEKGKSYFLSAADFSLIPGELWRSPDSGYQYPVSWRISVPCLQLELSQQTDLKNQELFSKDSVSPSYWEGAVTYNGQMRGQPVSGVGYLEMTGYAGVVRLGGK